MKKYVVREGDTMWSIAEATGVRPKLLIASNPQVKNPNQLRPGSVIVVPELTKGKDTTGKGGIGTVHPEAASHGAATPTGMAASGTPTSGTPASGTSGMAAQPGTPSTPAGTPAHSAPPTHTTAPTGTGAGHGGMPPFFGFVWPHAVQPGESWATIQQKYNVQMQHLLSMNPGIANRPLRPGDLVYIPGMVPPSQLPSWATQGMPGQGMPGQGMPAQGMPGQGMPGQGMPGQGMPGQGMPGQGMPGQGMPGQGMPGQGMPGQGMPTQPGYAGDPQSAQWTEPYGPHQHNPFRNEQSDEWLENPWQESSSWDMASGEGDHWRTTSQLADDVPYHKFKAPEPHASEISVYLGDPHEGVQDHDG